MFHVPTQHNKIQCLYSVRKNSHKHHNTVNFLFVVTVLEHMSSFLNWVQSVRTFMGYNKNILILFLSTLPLPKVLKSKNFENKIFLKNFSFIYYIQTSVSSLPASLPTSPFPRSTSDLLRKQPPKVINQIWHNKQQ